MRVLLPLLAIMFLQPAHAAVCKGEEPCKACKDCTACWYCGPKNPQGGSCGTLRKQNAEEAAQRMKKRGG